MARERARTRSIAIGLIAPWTAILIVTAAFHASRGALIDALVFFAVAVALILDAELYRRARPAIRLPPMPVTIAVAALLGAVLALSPRRGLLDGLILVAIGITVLPIAWSPPSAHSAHSSSPNAIRRAAIAWSSVGVFGCLWELSAFWLGLPSDQARWDHPAVSHLVDPVLEEPAGRAVFVALWLAAGIALLARRRST